MFYLVFSALVVICTFHNYPHCKFCHTHVDRFKPFFSINMINYTQYLTISPCFRRPCFHFYISYLSSLQILRTMQNVFLFILNNFKHQNDRFSRAFTRWFSILDGLTSMHILRRALRAFRQYFYT